MARTCRQAGKWTAQRKDIVLSVSPLSTLSRLIKKIAVTFVCIFRKLQYTVECSVLLWIVQFYSLVTRWQLFPGGVRSFLCLFHACFERDTIKFLSSFLPGMSPQVFHDLEANHRGQLSTLCPAGRHL